MKRLFNSGSILRKTFKTLLLTFLFTKMAYSQDNKNIQNYLNDIKKWDVAAVENQNQLEVQLSYNNNNVNKMNTSYSISLTDFIFNNSVDEKVYVLKRDGGTFTFTANKVNKFEENPKLRKQLESMLTEEVPTGLLALMTLGDLGFEELDVLKKENIPVSIEGLLMLSSKQMGAGTLTKRIKLMKDYNVDLSLESLVILADLNINEDYIAMLSSFGYTNLSASDIFASKSQNIDKEYIMSIKKQGYELGLSSLFAFKSMGITADWIEKMNKKQGSKLAFHQLLAMREQSKG